MTVRHDTAVYVRGEPYPTHRIIGIELKIGLNKEQIRDLCKELEITNFSQTWELAIEKVKAAST